MNPRLELVRGGKSEPLKKGDPVLVGGKPGTVVCPAFQTHVFQGMVSVDFGGGELALVETETVTRTATGETPPPGDV